MITINGESWIITQVGEGYTKAIRPQGSYIRILTIYRGGEFSEQSRLAPPKILKTLNSMFPA
jgi:hypothetical protein